MSDLTARSIIRLSMHPILRKVRLILCKVSYFIEVSIKRIINDAMAHACFLFAASKASFDLSGSLIPDVYPEGDPSLYALPIIQEEPKDQYTAKGNPAVLECKVAHATKVNFVCNDEVMSSTSEEHLVDPETSIRYTKIRLEVKRSDAMDVLGKFVCKCRAVSNKGEVDSRDASVSVACEYSC